LDIGQVNTTATMAAIVKQLETTAEIQVEVMKQMADSQQQIAELLQSLGIGQNIDVTA
jgi:hypothetical protein